jgi:hypothetical protein
LKNQPVDTDEAWVKVTGDKNAKSFVFARYVSWIDLTLRQDKEADAGYRAAFKAYHNDKFDRADKDHNMVITRQEFDSNMWSDYRE